MFSQKVKQIKTSQIEKPNKEKRKKKKKEKHPTVLHKPKFLTTRIWPSKGAHQPLLPSGQGIMEAYCKDKPRL